MPRIKCRYVDCMYLERGFCGADQVDFDQELGCLTYSQEEEEPMPKAAASSAPVGDMMVIVGTWLFGSPEAGWWFMFIQAITVLLALVGTTLSCMCTGARVTYAMGRDTEVPASRPIA